MTTPKLYMLIGVPGSGKSTWIANQDWTKDIPVVSSDKFIDEHAAKEGKTYNEVFEDYIKIATHLMENQLLICKANNTDIIWDQTNTSVKSRKAKLAKLEGYEKIAVVFRTPEKEELDKRLAQRVGKHIPANVMESMIANLQEPTEEEGFKEIWYAD
jgi:predicted kinase